MHYRGFISNKLLPDFCKDNILPLFNLLFTLNSYACMPKGVQGYANKITKKSEAGILMDKTLDNKLMYITNADKLPLLYIKIVG